MSKYSFYLNTIVGIFKLLVIATLTTSCAVLPKNNLQKASYAINDTHNTMLGRAAENQKRKYGRSDKTSGAYLLKDGLSAFVARAVLTQLAERSLDVQYYLFHSDLSGSLLFYELWKAANRGVRVRVLLDDMDIDGKDQTLNLLNSHPNIEIRIFNPFIRGKSRASQYITDFGSVTRRMHNKSFIVDNQFAILGGRNIGDEYFNANPNLAFGDLDVSLIGSVVNDTSVAFDLFWNSKLSYSVETLAPNHATQSLFEITENFKRYVEDLERSEYLQALRTSELAKQIRNDSVDYHWGKAVILHDHPDKVVSERGRTDLHLTPKFTQYSNNINKELIVVSPYFVPGKEGVEFFRSLVNRGINVRILTNSMASTDVPIVHSGYSRYRKQLLVAGVKLYELDKTSLGNIIDRKRKKISKRLPKSKTSLHAKYFILDRELTFIGSLNVDPRSVIENTEIGTMINSNTLAQELALEFDEQIKDIAFEVTLEKNKLVWKKYGNKNYQTESDPHTSWWNRVYIWLLQLLPVESQL